jgi:hypothetical protein
VVGGALGGGCIVTNFFWIVFDILRMEVYKCREQ